MTVLDRIIASLRGDDGIWPADTDWQDVLAVAERHGVAMLLARRVPNDVLRAWSRNATERAFQLAHQLRVAVDALNASGIDVLPVKGPTLAVTAYGDPARRGVSTDLDLVVRPRDVERALSALAALGYRRHAGAADREREDESLKSEIQLLPSTGPATMLELHADLVGNPNTATLNLDDVFDRSRIASLFGAPMRVMAVEDQLLYVCLHGARHFWSRLLWVCDVDAIIRSAPSIDWRAVASRAAVIEATQRLALGLHLADRYLATPVPSQPAIVASGRPVERVTALVGRRMRDTSAGRIPSFRLLLACELAVRETHTQRLTYVRTKLAPNRLDRAWVRLPKGLAWLHVLLRPLRLLTRYANPHDLRR
jgi:hypothetical protein